MKRALDGNDIIFTHWLAEKRHLVKLLAGIFLVIFTATAFLFVNHHRNAMDNSREEDRGIARMVSLLLEENNQKIIGVMQSYAYRPLLIQAAREKNAEAAGFHLADLAKDLPLVHSLILTDREGTVWSRHPHLAVINGMNMAHREWYRGVSREWRPHISDVFLRAVEEKDPAVLIAVPILDPGGEAIGILAATLRAVSLKEFFALVPLHPGMSISLIDRGGNLAYSGRLSLDREIVPYPFRSALGELDSPGLPPVAVSDPAPGGLKRMLSFASVPSSGFTVVLERETRSVIRADRPHYSNLAMVSGLLFLLAVLAVFSFRRKAMIRQALEALRTEKELLAREARFRELFDRMNSGVVVYLARDDGADFIILDINEAGQRITGTDTKIIGRSVRDVFPGIVEFGLFQVFQRVWKSGTAEIFPLAQYQDERLAFWTSNQIYKLPTGELVAVFDDVTDRIKAEAELKERDTRYLKLSFHVPGVIYQFMMKPDGSFSVPFATEAIRSFFDLSPDDVRESFEPFLKVVLPEDLDPLKTSIVSSAENMTTWSWEFRVRVPGRPVRWIQGHSTPEKHVDGSIVWHGFLTDITERKQAEEQFNTDRSKLSNALEIALLGPWEYDLATDLFIFNDQFYRLFRTTAEEAGGYTMASGEYARRFVHPGDFNMVRDEILKANETTDPRYTRQFDHRIIYADGTPGHISVRFSIIKDSHGRTIKTYGVNQDITERARALEALRESEEKYRRIAENIADVVWVNDLNLDTLYVSPSIEKMVGEPPAAYMARTMEERFPPNSLKRITSSMVEEFEKEKDPGKDLRRTRLVEVEHYRTDGTLIWISMNITFIRDEEGNAVGLLGVSRDITDRKQAEEKYRNIFENAQEGIFQTTREGGYLTVNRAMASILGYDSPEDLIASVTDSGRQIYADPEGRTRLITLLGERGGKIAGYETRFVRKDGKVIWVSISGRMITDADGQNLFFEGILEDITARKASLDQIRKALSATVKAIAVIVEVRDPYTAGHQRRVADLSRAIATKMGLPPDRIDGLRLAGIIHDLGKIAVPAEILSKPSQLTELEFRMIQIHPQAGFDILKGVEFPWPIARMVLEHHERMDGSGYPNGLTGDRMLVESRILAVADVVESMASHRPYRPAIGIEAALDEITRRRGSLYDPDVVDACLDIFQKGFQLKG